jgi:hypothetical protein
MPDRLYLTEKEGEMTCQTPREKRFAAPAKVFHWYMKK